MVVPGTNRLLFSFSDAVHRAGRLCPSPRIGAGPLFALWVLLFTAPIALHAEAPTVLFYQFQEADLSPANRTALTNALAAGRKTGPYILVQGFACDLGGYDASIGIAEIRGEVVRRLIVAAGNDPALIRVADPVVIPGEDRPRHRRVEISFYPDADSLLAAKRKADAAAEAKAETFLKTEVGSTGFRWFWIIPVLILLALLLFWIMRRRSRDETNMDFLAEHALRAEEAEALEVLTGGSIGPLLPAPPEDRRPDTRRLKMPAPKKSKQPPKLNPISIRSAVDREFEGKTLTELLSSPVHALQGLSPRHSKMLQEAFGIKTVEDLARLKYFEIAKAIAILAKYEK